jgi:hypothetical protein
MDILLTTIGILLGTILTIIGLLMIAPQVKVHQIRVNSWGSWLFRLGMVLAMVGLVINIISVDSTPLQNIGIVTGVSGLMGGIITWGHERKQALDNGAAQWEWRSSLTLQMVILGGITFVLGLLG